jgi:hypothetical protein
MHAGCNDLELVNEVTNTKQIINNYIREIHKVKFFDMQVVHISCHIITIK